MPARSEHSSPEVEEDLGFQRWEWKAERIGWAAMAALVLLSLLGLFGDGPLSVIEQEYADGFQLKYERFGRYLSPDEIFIVLPPSAVQEGQASLWIEQKFLESIQIETIAPQPDQTIVEPERSVFVFEVGPAPQPVEVKIDYRPQGRGINAGKIGWGQGQEADLTQFVYP